MVGTAAVKHDYLKALGADVLWIIVGIVWVLLNPKMRGSKLVDTNVPKRDVADAAPLPSDPGVGTRRLPFPRRSRSGRFAGPTEARPGHYAAGWSTCSGRPAGRPGSVVEALLVTGDRGEGAPQPVEARPR